MNTNTSQSRKTLPYRLKPGILVDIKWMLRFYKADKPPISLLSTQFPLTITVICIFKSVLISDNFEKLDLRPTPSPKQSLYVLVLNILYLFILYLYYLNDTWDCIMK